MANQIDMFPDAQMKSPKLRWIEKHELFIHRFVSEEYCKWKGIPFDDGLWFCTCDVDCVSDLEEYLIKGSVLSYQSGETEFDALSRWAISNKVPLWNEEVAT